MLKSTAYFLLMIRSCVLAGMETEIVELSALLSATIEQIQTVKEGQLINVTEKDHEKLLTWTIRDTSENAEDKERIYWKPNSVYKASIQAALYTLKRDSTLNKEYKWYSFSFGHQNNPLLATAHHLEIYRLEEAIPKLSIFNHSYVVKAKCYDLDIIYRHPDRPLEIADHFELKNSDKLENENPGFMIHAKRIEELITKNEKNASLKDLVILKRK
jgi:hypothetical protein